MDTLLNKAQDIESEAAELVQQAEKAGAGALTELRAKEDNVIADIRAKAHARAQEIIQERVQEAEKEVNTIKQHGDNAAKTVHEAATKNRADAIALAQRLFQEEYIG